LEQRRARLRAFGERAGLLQALGAELDGTDDSLVPRVAHLIQRLEKAQTAGGDLQALVASLSQALAALHEAGAAVSGSQTDEADADISIEAVEQRLHALYGLKKKFGGSFEAALSERERISENLRYLEQGQDLARNLARAAEEARKALVAAGDALQLARQIAVGRMQRALRDPLSELGLGTDPVSVAFTGHDPDTWTEEGPATVEFFLRANPGEEPKSLSKIASGGELSRLMLAFKSAMPGRLGVDTLVFDEIDSGIGGETAFGVGQRLLALASGRQVIVITHLPQIAGLAARHFEVRKQKRGGRHLPQIKLLDSGEREAALGRLLAGERTSATARAAARALFRSGRSD
jgi:DNA repair protein RecN (Recombination protein N)